MSKNKKYIIISSIIILVLLVTLYIKCFYNSDNKQNGIIKIFNKDYENFADLAKYIETYNGNIYISRSELDNNGNLKILNGIDGNYNISNDSNDEVHKRVNYTIYSLDFSSIKEDDEYIRFSKCVTRGLEKGILYLKKGSKPNIHSVHIKDKWYYYTEQYE